MLFGLFKKHEVADIVFRGGRVYTLNPDSPWVEAVACKDGRILAVGDRNMMDDVTDDETIVIDLKGGTLLPGFIEICGHPVLQAFRKACLILYDDMPQDAVLSALAEYIKKNPDNHGYFAYGYNAKLHSGKTEEEIRTALDAVCSDKPVAMLDISGFHGWFNNKAIELVKAAAAAEEQEPPVITLPYVLHVLSPIDYDLLQGAIIENASEYCAKGYTAIFDCGSPDFLHHVYQEMLVEMLQVDMLKQRFMGSLMIVKNITSDYAVRKLMQKSDACNELEEYISCRTLKLVVEAGADSPDEDYPAVTHELLKTLAVKAADKGFDFHIDAVGKEAVSQVFEAIFLTRAAGYRKNHFIIAQSCGLSQEEEAELLLDSELRGTFSTLGDFNKRHRGVEDAKDLMDAIDKLTIDAADLLGISDDFGSVEIGKRADFAIYKENLKGYSLPDFLTLDCRMTVMDGDIVYDADEDNPKKWHLYLKERQREMQEQISMEEDEEFY